VTAVRGAKRRAAEPLRSGKQNWVDPNKVGQRIAEGLGAMETIFFRHRGAATDSVNVIA